MKLRIVVAGVAVCLTLSAQTGGVFGTRIPAPGALQDLVLDESRQRLYLVNNANNEVDVFSIPDQRFLSPMPVQTSPVSAAMSPDGQFLYVTNFGSSSLSVIDLGLGGQLNAVSLPAPPEGVAVGVDGRVLITTLGSGNVNGVPQNVLLLFDPTQTGVAQLTSISFPPPAPQDPRLPGFTTARAFQTFRSRLQATPDGQFIIGANAPNANQTSVFVYEVGSGTVLRSRLTPNLSTVFSIAPDGSRFMAGLRLFETSTLNVLAATNINNAPFLPTPGFIVNLNQNVGGSAFSPAGTTLYSAFNVAPANPPTQPRPNSSTLFISNPRNLAINLAVRLPESVLGKMVSTSDGSTVYALSETGVLMLPVGKLYDYPILMPEKTAVRLSMNPCDRGLVTADLKVLNAGKGKLTFTFAQPGGANPNLLAQATSGVAPSSIRLMLNPRFTGTRFPGTQTFILNLQSPEAINIPPVIRVYQNFEAAGQTGETLPVEVSISGAEGLVDIQVDDRRERVYMANSGMNRIEVYDFRNKKMLPPIEVGQLPRSMAMTSDGSQLFVGNSGGEWISIIDLNLRQQVGKVDFPPLPFSANIAQIGPRSMAMGIFGPQFVATDGTVWSVRAGVAVPRSPSTVLNPTPPNLARVAAGATGMVSTPGNEAVILMDNAGNAFRYDSLSDTWVNSQAVMTPPINSYYGPLAAGPGGQYYLANRATLNSTLVPTGGITSGVGAGGIAGGGAGAATASTRHQAAAAPISTTTYARFTVPPQANPGATPTGDQRPLVQVVDIATGASLMTAAAPEGPAAAIFGTIRSNIAPRMMAVDGAGANAFLITTSGLSVVSLRQPSATDAPVINNGGIVNGANFNRTVAPGSLISIFGRNLANTATASDLPLPQVLGGACVTFNDVTLPLLSTSPTQINAQLPPDALPGATAVAVRSLVTGLQSETTLVNVSRSAPGVFAIGGNTAALFHASDMRQVTASNPAQRGEVLVLFGTGIPPGDGQQLESGAPAPFNPLITTATPRVFLGNPDASNTETQILWSGFTPGFIGLNQVNLQVSANATTGDNLPVVVRTADGESPRTGPLAPVTSIR